MPDIPSTNTNLFRSLFRGREDVFAIRWEKSGKTGYMPAYQFDPYHYRIHKMNGGTFANYPHKTYLPLTDNEIQKHLNGAQQIGIYPLLQDNTSWFLVADFDKQNWQEEAVNFLNACKVDIPRQSTPLFRSNMHHRFRGKVHQSVRVV